MASKKKIIKTPYRILLLLVVTLLLIKNISLTLLIADISAYIDILIHSLIIYLIVKNHRFTEFVIWVWSTLFLFVYTGIKLGAKSLIIWRGDGWEINTQRYYIDLFLFLLGLLLMIFGHKIYKEESSEL
ncbi:MAG: hypothetical protein AAFZ15_26275 [Bacteroidota bacterium]